MRPRIKTNYIIVKKKDAFYIKNKKIWCFVHNHRRETREDAQWYIDNMMVEEWRQQSPTHNKRPRE
jgi:hypothetical protein